MTSALHHIPNRTKKLPPLRVGIGGPVCSGNAHTQGRQFFSAVGDVVQC